MSLIKIKSTFYNNIRQLLAIFVLLLSFPAHSRLCVEVFQAPLSLELILASPSNEQVQDQTLQFISKLAQKISKTKSIKQRNKQIETLVKSWDLLRHDLRPLTQNIIQHFEKRLKYTLIDLPIVRQRLYGDNSTSLFSVQNFPYQLPYVILSLKFEKQSLKEVPYEN